MRYILNAVKTFMLCAIIFPVLLSQCYAQSVTGPSEKPRIGIIGAGWMGGTVGRAWVRAGYHVMFSTRHPQELESMVKPLGKLASIGTPREAAAYGDVIFLATPYGAIPQISHDYAKELSGKVILDATNASGGHGSIFDEAEKDGDAVTNARYFHYAKLVRAFSSVWANAIEASSVRANDKLAVPIASNDPAALPVAETLVKAAGCVPVSIGDLSKAYLFELGGPAVSINTTEAHMRTLLGLAPQ
ncbi:NADPH-dependent F420 reductase [Celerinatantimonas sp. YJH-8]|uniref:NADPH-dependent F420 reductase n=1 Tax=Celerinatantimonas sp. YJH-8 TaxID=3228714 RepID=UPI0038CB45D0